jgi:hypothetical protein
MKITMKDVKKMILQEVNETLSPLDFSQGRDPSMTTGGDPTGFPAINTPAEPGNPAHEHFVTLKSLYGAARADAVDDPDYERFLTAVSDAAGALVKYLGK